MHGIPEFGFDLFLIFSVATLVVLLFHLIRQPAIAGFLLSGLLVGPSGLGLISNTDRINAFAEVGVVLLLFSLGIEFSVSRLRDMGRAFFGVGPLQCVGTMVAVGGILMAAGVQPVSALLLGAFSSLSSTAIILKLIQERRETNSAHGRLTIAVALFQDLWVVPLMMAIPLLAPGGAPVAGSLWITLVEVAAKVLLLAGAIFVGARIVVPKLLEMIAKTRMRELFLIVVALIAFGTAYATSLLGLSLALGAFAAGVMIADSEYGHQAVAEIVPLRDPMMALFFISIGMLLDFQFFIDHVAIVTLLTLAVVVIKFAVVGGLAQALGFPVGVAALGGLFLAQIGEFAFVLAQQAHQASVITPVEYQKLLAVTLLSMCISPSIVKFAPRLAPVRDALALLPSVVSPLRELVEKGQAAARSSANQVIIIGFGHNGRALAHAFSQLSIPFVVIEMNVSSVREATDSGVNAIFGDASRPEILEAAGIEHARVAVVCISAPNYIHQVVHAIRAIRPDLHVLVRSHYLAEVAAIEDAGANDIVVGELETAFELLGRVLERYGVSHREIELSLARIQDERYRSVRRALRPEASGSGLPGWFDTFEVLPIRIYEGSPGIGTTLESLDLENRTGATVVAVRREGIGTHVARPDMELHVGDMVFALGAPDAVEKLARVLHGEWHDI